MKTNTKEWIQYGSAITMMLSGMVLAFISFFLKGVIENGVLMYIAEALVFSGAIYGVNIYYRTKFGDFENRTVDNLRNEFKKYLDNYMKDYIRNN